MTCLPSLSKPAEKLDWTLPKPFILHYNVFGKDSANFVQSVQI